MNVMGAFKHLVSQMDELFDYKLATTIQSASILGSHIEHPLTTADELRQFKDHWMWRKI